MQGGKEQAAIDIKQFEARAAGAANLGGQVEELTVQGTPALVRGLLQSAELRSGPPQLRQAAELVERFGVNAAVGGKVTLSKVGYSQQGTGAAARQQVQGNLATSVVVPGVGALELALQGFQAVQSGQGTAVDFTRFEARLKDPQGGGAASLLIEGQKPGDKAASGSIKQGGSALELKKVTVGGSGPGVARLLAALRGQVKDLPPALAQVVQVVEANSAALALSGSMELQNVKLSQGPDGKLQAKGNVSGDVEVPGAGKLRLSVQNLALDQTRAGAGAGLGFDRLEAKLLLADGKTEAAALLIENPVKGSVGQGGADAALAVPKIQASGKTKHLATISRALEQRVGGMRPEVQQAVRAVQAYLPTVEMLDADAAMTISNLGLEKQGGQLAAKGDLSGRIAAPGIGAIDLQVKGYRGNPTDPNDQAFDRFEARLTDPAGKEAAFFAVQAAKDGSDKPYFGDPSKHVSFAAEKVELRGESKGISQMLSAIEQKVTGLPAGVRSVFALAKDYGPALDAGGAITLDGAKLDVTDGKATLRGNSTARISSPELGTVHAEVVGFEVGQDIANFERLEARLVGKDGRQAARVAIEADRDEAERVALQGGFPEKVKSVHVEGSSQQIAALLRALDGRMGPVPEPVMQTLRQAERFLARYQVDGELALEDVALKTDAEKTDIAFTAPVGKDSVLTQALKEGSKVAVNLKGFVPGTAEVGSSFDALQVQLLDPQGKSVAALQASGFTTTPVGKGASFELDKINLDGDGRLLAAALQPELLSALGPQAREALEMVKNLRLAGKDGSFTQQESGYSGSFADLTLSGGITLTDDKGMAYTCENAELTARAPKVTLDRAMKLQSLDAAQLSGKARLTRSDGGLTVDGAVSVSDVKATMGPDGKPQTFSAGEVRAGGTIEASGPEQAGDDKAKKNLTREEQLASMAKAQDAMETGAALLKDAQIHTSTPVYPGRYGFGFGSIGVPNGTTLEADLVIKGRQVLVGANGTKVRFSNPLDGPLWIGVGGAYLEEEGTKGALKADLKGFFDLEATKLLNGKGSLSLRLSEMVDEIMSHQRQAAASRTPKDEQNDAAKKAKAEERLAREHAGWEKERNRDEAGYDDDRQDVEADRNKWEEKYGRKQAEARSEGERSSLAEKNRRKQADYDKELARIEEKRRREASKDAEKEPRGSSAADLFGPRGMDPTKTSGNANVTLASEGQKDRELAPGVLVPGKQEIHLQGAASGSGTVNLTADQASALIYGQRVSAQGLNTGEVSVSADKADGKSKTKVSFSSFYLKHLDWQAPAKLPDKDKPQG